jgi:hypothetical protein
VETERPHTNEGRRRPPRDSNVVRLRDWIGPEEELVPFGPRARSADVDGGLHAGPSADVDGGLHAGPSADVDGGLHAGQPPVGMTTLTPQPPPAAADFWGERSAAVHDALRAPDEHDAVPVYRGREGRQAAGGEQAAEDHRAGEREGRSSNVGCGHRVRQPWRNHAARVRQTIRHGNLRPLAPAFAAPVRLVRGRWRQLLAVGVLAIAVAILVGFASSGTRVGEASTHVSGVAKINVASLLQAGVARMLSVGAPRIANVRANGASSAQRARAAHVRRAPHPPPALQASHQSVPSEEAAQVSPQAPAPTYTAPPAPAPSTAVASSYHPSESGSPSEPTSSSSEPTSSSSEPTSSSSEPTGSSSESTGSSSESSPSPNSDHSRAGTSSSSGQAGGSGSSGAPVSATGASGPLGPIQSPNG